MTPAPSFSGAPLCTSDNVTERVITAFAQCEDPRLKEVMEKLVHHLHAFARDARLTKTEWEFGIVALLRAGLISSPVRNEFMGFSDTLGLSSIVELLAIDEQDATPPNLLGPFYEESAPELEYGADLRGSLAGEPTLLRGHVLDLDSKPIAGARINLWQTMADGLYDVQVPELKEAVFRGWMTTREDGSFAVRTIKPVGYTAPMDGPLGEMLRATSRNEWRPAHWHFLIRADGYRHLTTELYPHDAAHLYDDVAFGPREALVVKVRLVDDQSIADANSMPHPFHLAEYDFRLIKADA